MSSDYSNYFVNLYKNILEEEKKKFKVKEDLIRNAIQVMRDAYLPDPSWRSKSISDLGTTNYDDPAFRCAYLHKYAMCYTGMVCHLLKEALDKSNDIYVNFDRMEKVHLCSLGGGPGTDIVGVLAALASRNLDIESWSATIIDLAENWKITFSSILSELQCGSYGSLRKMAKKLHPFAYFLRTNLLGNWDSEPLTEQKIRTADVVLMVKFISAAACNFYTENMVEKVFHYLKPGAMVLFIDNAAGGFDKMVKQKSLEVGLTSIYGPLHHYHYENLKFDLHRFGFKSQSKSKVVFEVYQKPRYSRPSYFKFQSRIVAQAGIDYVPESYNPRRRIDNRAMHYNQEMLQTTHVEMPGQQRANTCDVIIYFVIMFLIVVVIKLYREI